MIPYAELQVTSNFSFLRGASHASDMVARAMALGLAGIGIAGSNFMMLARQQHQNSRQQHKSE